MESVRVHISYRPLRVAWAIRDGDIGSFRSAVQFSNALWGGRFNPIVVVDRKESADFIVEQFRVDMIFPVGDSEPVRSYPARFSYLPKPFMHDDLFLGTGEYASPCQILDVHNALVHLRRETEWEEFKKHGVRLYRWKPDDPLADALSIHLGAFPRAGDVGVDYEAHFLEATDAKEFEIDMASELPADLFRHPTVSSLSGYGLQRRLSFAPTWDHAGFYSGDAENFDDLVTCWNLCAAHIPLFFVDPNRLERYGATIGAWEETLRPVVSRRRFESERNLALWARFDPANHTAERIRELMKPFQGKASTVCRVEADSLTGDAVRPPVMNFDDVSTLGIVSSEFGKPRVSFALEARPFDGDNWFRSQMLVASVSFIGASRGDNEHTFSPPYIPELNEFYSREMVFDYGKLRSEPQGLGLIVDAAETGESVHGLPVADLIQRIFDLSGFDSRLSDGGLIVRQLIAQLGGVDRARAFKIPGVRRLLKTFSPTESFTKRTALQLIGSRDPGNPGASFQDHENLYIEPRLRGGKLSPQAVFEFLVEKGLFRIGAELECPNCSLPSWTALDALKQRLVCELCGHEFDATRQLMREDWRYRRSGVLGRERNAQGAIPVILTLQQFDVNLSGALFRHLYSPSLNVEPKPGLELPKCEIDFVWVLPQYHPSKTAVLIGECKDSGNSRRGEERSGTIDAHDIENLRRVADAFPSARFDAFVVLAKLCPFTAEEIARARSLNGPYRQRVILLTAKELEPYHLFERT